MCLAEGVLMLQIHLPFNKFPILYKSASFCLATYDLYCSISYTGLLLDVSLDTNTIGGLFLLLAGTSGTPIWKVNVTV